MEHMNKVRSKLRHLLLLVSVISLCSSPFWYPCSFLHYFKLYFSSFAPQILSHTIDKNCMFLLCNGLLVFIGITGSFSSFDPPHHHDHVRLLDHEDEETLQRCSCIEDTSEVEVKELMVDGEKEEDDGNDGEEEEDDDDGGVGGGGDGGDDDGDDDDEDEGKENGVLGLDLKEELEEDEWLRNEGILGGENVEGEDWRLSTEQMNKKFDDFIRRMKEDLRFEAKRQIVMVYGN